MRDLRGGDPQLRGRPERVLIRPQSLCFRLLGLERRVANDAFIDVDTIRYSVGVCSRDGSERR